MYFHSNCIVQFPDLTKDNDLRTRTQETRGNTLLPKATNDGLKSTG